MLFFGDALIVPGSDVGPYLEAEKQRVAELRDEGFITQLFRRCDGTGVVLILEADSAAAAHERLAALPFVQRGLMTIPVTELEQL
jgi:hypothetical protein